VAFVDKQAKAACPPGFDAATPLYDKAELKADAPVCSCECGAASGESCRGLLTCNAGNTCSASIGNVTRVGGCAPYTIPVENGTNACQMVGTETANGKCTPQVTPAITPPSWEASSRVCGASAAGACASPAEACVPKLPGAVGPCIAQTGDHACPAGTPYSQKTSYFDGAVDDKRSCTDSGCSCGSAAGGKCGCDIAVCGIVVFNINTCSSSSQIQPVIDGGGCQVYNDGINNPDDKWGVALSTGYSVKTAGTCPASGTGTPTGEVAPTGPVTVCCVP
jgi:hypothetical protein